MLHGVGVWTRSIFFCRVCPLWQVLAVGDQVHLRCLCILSRQVVERFSSCSTRTRWRMRCWLWFCGIPSHLLYYARSTMQYNYHIIKTSLSIIIVLVLNPPNRSCRCFSHRTAFRHVQPGPSPFVALLSSAPTPLPALCIVDTTTTNQTTPKKTQ
ncbi:hypothetical protein BJY00DRAFT_204691 [Aspergillus carlsbadensis]|nr:hypothetical protein BJY00DRAFT_204691 [Aspergillus carlsbadensis]